VDTAVTSQTRRVREAFATAHVLAVMRLLARVRTDVHGQCTSLDEALAAACRGAGIGALIRVDAVVSLQVRFAVEALYMGSWLDFKHV
jgi:hypothetical protein